ncbi:hypothetical protein HAP98_01490, partial [Acidithiobacillus caldus]|nr:hypothetical protein [Acidithiobacillus caldus]
MEVVKPMAERRIPVCLVRVAVAAAERRVLAGLGSEDRQAAGERRDGRHCGAGASAVWCFGR